MADVYCANCREPWDTYYLRHELPQEFIPAILPDCESNHLNHIRKTGRVPDVPWLRREYERSDWKLANWSIFAVLHCPCCKSNKGNKPDNKLAEKYKGVTEALGNDADGIESELSEL